MKTLDLLCMLACLMVAAPGNLLCQQEPVHTCTTDSAVELLKQAIATGQRALMDQATADFCRQSTASPRLRLAPDLFLSHQAQTALTGCTLP